MRFPALHTSYKKMLCDWIGIHAVISQPIRSGEKKRRGNRGSTRFLELDAVYMKLPRILLVGLLY